jgi:hypothetical protein
MNNLHYFANKLYDVSDTFYDLYDSTKNIYLIGYYLSGGFYTLYSITGWGAYYCWQAGNTLDDILNNWDWLVNQGGFKGMLDNISIVYSALRTNPALFVAAELALASTYLYDLVYYPATFVDTYIRALSAWYALLLDNPLLFIKSALRLVYYIPDWLFNEPIYCAEYFLRLSVAWAGGFLDNPLGFIISRLTGYNYWIDWLFNYPLWFVDYFIRQLNPMFGSLLDNPAMFIAQLFAPLFPDVYSFIIDPVGFLKIKIAGFLGYPVEFWSNPFFFLAQSLIHTIHLYLVNLSNDLISLLADLIVMWL